MTTTATATTVRNPVRMTAHSGTDETSAKCKEADLTHAESSSGLAAGAQALAQGSGRVANQTRKPGASPGRGDQGRPAHKSVGRCRRGLKRTARLEGATEVERVIVVLRSRTEVCGRHSESPFAGEAPMAVPPLGSWKTKLFWARRLLSFRPGHTSRRYEDGRWPGRVHHRRVPREQVQR